MSSDDILETADFYECVNDEDNLPHEPAGTIAAMAYIQEENDALTDHQLEVQ